VQKWGGHVHPSPPRGDATGCTGCTFTPPPGRRKKLGAKFTGKSCKCTPCRQSVHPRQRKSRISCGNWEIWTVGLVNLVVLGYVLKATTKKRSSTFSAKKSAPQRKSWLRLELLVIVFATMFWHCWLDSRILRYLLSTRSIAEIIKPTFGSFISNTVRFF